MEIGDFFLFRSRNVNEHPFVVISMPDLDAERVVIVSLTSYDKFYHEIEKDGSCVLQEGDHAWIHHQTCVSYRDAKIVTHALLDQLESDGAIVKLTPVSDDLLTRILEGAQQTDELPGKCRKVLEDQDLIED